MSATTELVAQALEHVKAIPAVDLTTQSKRQAAEKSLERALEELRHDTDRAQADQRPADDAAVNLVGEAGPELDVDDEAGTVTS